MASLKFYGGLLMKPNVKIIKQRRRSLMMRALPGVVEVYIPYQLDENDRMVRDFVVKGLQKLGDDLPEIPPEITTQKQIRAMVNAFAPRMGVNPTRVQFREMIRKWGSCSSKGTVTLNSRLCWLDAELAEYIVCHELAHLIELNHSKRFWAIVEQHMPDYKARLERLREVEKTLW